jgi:hypothetical protein
MATTTEILVADMMGVPVSEAKEADSATLGYWGGPVLDAFHFIVNRLSAHEQLNDYFAAWSYEHARNDYASDALEAFVTTCFSGNVSVQGANTYNGEDFLSATLQYHVLRNEYYHGVVNFEGPAVEGYPDGLYIEDVLGQDLVFLQIHRGGDVRGNYSDPAFFTLDDEAFLYDNASAYLICAGVEEQIVPGQITFDGEVISARLTNHQIFYSGGLLEEARQVSTEVFEDSTGRTSENDLAGYTENELIDTSGDVWKCRCGATFRVEAPFA